MRVFLSHSVLDTAQAHRIRNYFSHHNTDVSFVMPDMTTGSNLQENIYDSINNSDAILFLISKNTEKSEWMSQEISLATYNKLKGKDIRLIPLLLDKDVEVPFFLKNYLYLDISDNTKFQDAMLKLTHALNKKTNTTMNEELSFQAERIKIEEDYLKIMKLEHQEYKKHQSRQLFLLLMISTTMSAALVSLSLVGWLAKIEFSQFEWIFGLLVGIFSSALGVLFYLKKAKSNRAEILKRIEDLNNTLTKMRAGNDR